MKEVRTNFYRRLPMFKIVRFPSKLNTFFRSLTTKFHWDHFEYFRILVLLIAFGWGRRNITALYRYLDTVRFRHRSRFNNFLNKGRWSPEKALAEKAYELLARLKGRPGEVVELIIDDSKKGKRGKHMDAVGWIHDPLTGKSIRGHLYVKATLRFRGHTIPFGVCLYVKKDDCKALNLAFKKTTQLAAELIRAFEPSPNVAVRVLFDAYYLCPVVVKACKSKGFHFVSTLKSNRNLFKNGRKLKAGIYGKNLFCRLHKKCFSTSKGKKTATYRYVDAGWLRVSSFGYLHVIYSRKNRDRKILGIATDDPKLSPAKMIKAYDERWSIEVFFKDAKQLLGLGQYQNRSYRAAVTHLHLVCFAYALLTHIAIDREGAKGKCKQAAKPSTGDIQNELRRIVWEDLAEHLQELPDGNSVIKELSRLLVAA